MQTLSELFESEARSDGLYAIAYALLRNALALEQLANSSSVGLRVLGSQIEKAADVIADALAEDED